MSDPVFEQIPQTRRAFLEQTDRVRGFHVLREHQNSDIGMVSPNVPGCANPFIAVRRRHPDVQIGASVEAWLESEQFICRARFTHGLDARLPEQSGQA